MPNITNQAKRVRTNRKSELNNKKQKSALKTTLSALNAAIAEQDSDSATKLLNTANSLLDKSITGNRRHKNYVSRKKAIIAKAYNTLK